MLAPFLKTENGMDGVLQYGMPKVCCAGDGCVLPAEFEARRPQGVDSVLFASALYELCNQKDLDNLRYARLKAIKSMAIS